MLRIARNEAETSRVGAGAQVEVLRLEGKVVGRWVDELRQSCDEILHRPERELVLDLTDVSFIDLGGLALFEELAARRVTLRNCSPFAAEQLKTIRRR